MENFIKIIEDLRRIADRVEERKPGYKEKCRRDYQELLNDTSIFDAIDAAAEIEVIEKDDKN